MYLNARELSLTYSTKTTDVVALDGIDLNIAKGEFVTLIGPSGCGKSTLLHCLGGLLAPTAGEVSVGGDPFIAPDPAKAAFVFQDYSLYPWKTVLENAAIGLRFARVSKPERLAKAMEFLNMVGLDDFTDAYPHQLSGGMQQRVAVARALAMDPDILLMDEPFGALDEQTRRQLGYEMCKLLSEQEKSVLMVTHSLDEAIFWADRIVVMSARPGRIRLEIPVEVPRPRDLSFIASPEFAAIRAQLLELLTPPTASVLHDAEEVSA